MYKNNKSGVLGKLVTIVLILIAAVIIYGVLTSFISANNFQGAINACRFSVLGQVATELKPGISGMKSPFSINCQKRYVHFYNTKVELGLNPSNMEAMTVIVGGKKITRFKELTDSIVDQVIADEMRTCKYEFADGKADIFTNNDKRFGSQYVCFVCSEIDFDKTVNKKVFNSLVQYTNKTTLSNEGITYYQYLTETTTFGNAMWEQPTYAPTDDQYFNLSIDTSQPYLVYIRKKTTSNINPLSKDAIWVKIAPAKDINKNNECNLQAS